MEHPSDAHTIAERELMSARNRIIATTAMHGGEEPAAVAWLLSFLAGNIAELNSLKQDELWGTVVRFCIDAGQEGTALGRMGGVQYCFPKNRAERTRIVEQIQKNTRDALDGFVKTGIGTFPKGEGAFTLLRGSWLVPGDQPLRYRGGDLASSFYYMSAQLLARYGYRVKQCRGCPKIMLVGRKDKRYHSQSCQIVSWRRNKPKKEKAERLRREQVTQMRAEEKQAARKPGKGKPWQQKGKRHGTKR